jgi:phosphatidate cytidylyltransferase
MLVDYYLRILHFDRRMPLNIDLGPLHIHLYARAVFFMWVTVAILGSAVSRCWYRAGGS